MSEVETVQSTASTAQVVSAPSSVVVSSGGEKPPTPEQVAESVQRGLSKLSDLKTKVAAADAGTAKAKADGERRVAELQTQVNGETAKVAAAAEQVRGQYHELGRSLVSQGLVSKGLLETMGHHIPTVRKNSK